MGQIFGRPPCRGDLTIAGATSELHTAIAFQTALASRSHRPTSDADRGNIVTPTVRFFFFSFSRILSPYRPSSICVSLSFFFLFFFFFGFLVRQARAKLRMYAWMHVCVGARPRVPLHRNKSVKTIAPGPTMRAIIREKNVVFFQKRSPQVGARSRN